MIWTTADSHRVAVSCYVNYPPHPVGMLTLAWYRMIPARGASGRTQGDPVGVRPGIRADRGLHKKVDPRAVGRWGKAPGGGAVSAPGWGRSRYDMVWLALTNDVANPFWICNNSPEMLMLQCITASEHQSATACATGVTRPGYSLPGDPPASAVGHRSTWTCRWFGWGGQQDPQSPVPHGVFLRQYPGQTG